MPKVTQQGTEETRLMTFRPELRCPLLIQKEGRGQEAVGQLRAQLLPREMSRAVFSSLSPLSLPQPLEP